MILAAEDFFRWQPHPEVWVLLLGLIGLYVYAAKALGPRIVKDGPAVTKAQARWFALGITLLWIASDWPLHDLSEEYLYSLHMVQHLLLTFVIPPVMLLATPEWLARIVIGDGKAWGAFRWIARPIQGAVIFNAVQLATHWQTIVNTSVENGLLHYGLHTLVVTTAIAVWMPIVSPIPEMRTTPPAQCIHLFLTSIVPTVPAAWLAFSEGVVYEAYDKPARLWGVSVTSDQQAAGLLMKLAGGGWLWLLIVFIFFRWSLDKSADRGTTARRVEVGADGTILRVDGHEPVRQSAPDELTYDSVTASFDNAPAPAEPSSS